MNKNILITTSLFFSVCAPAQLAVQSIQNNETELLVNDSIKLKKGDFLQIYLPAGKDFMFVKQKKSALSTKLIESLSDIAGTGASTIAIGSGNFKVIEGASKVINTANIIHRGSNTISKIEELPISNQARKIAGKRMQIIGWKFTDNGYIISTQFDKKKYEIYLQEAAISGEIKFK